VEFRNFNQKLKELGCTIHIETSGAYEMSGTFGLDYAFSQKTPKEEIYKVANELKIIVFNNHDFTFAKNKLPKFLKIVNYMQSEWSKRNEMYPKITDFILANPKWQASVQTHKYLNIP
jgi:organic radical activating enzyme